MRTQSTGIRRLAKEDALEDAKRLREDIGLRHHTAKIQPRARKRRGEYVGYVIIREGVWSDRTTMEL